MARNRLRTRRPRATRRPQYLKMLSVSKAGIKRRRYAKRTGRGFISLVRKMPIINVINTGVDGSASLVDPTGFVASIGTPVLSPGFGSEVYDIPFSLKFNLKSLIQSGDMVSLCDQYKIAGAYVRIFYNNSNLAMGGTGKPASMPFVQYITDHDDATIPDPVNFRAKMGVKLQTFRNNSSYIGIKARPVPAAEVYGSEGTTAYSVPRRSPWLNTSDADVPHYAIKGILSQVTLSPIEIQTSVFTFDIAEHVLGKDFQ